MDKEANDDEGSQEEEICPSKRIWSETMFLDEEENEIASGLHPLHETSPVASQLEQDKPRSQDGKSGDEGDGDGEGCEQGGVVVDIYSGDGHTGFEDNRVCPLPFCIISMFLISTILDSPLSVCR